MDKTPSCLTYTARQAADALQISLPTFYSLANTTSDFPVFRIGKKLLVDAKALEDRSISASKKRLIITTACGDENE